jgi:hypothetical protein
MAAGMGHCSGGSGADSFDAVTPLVEWVERGRAPATIEAAKRDADGTVLFTRPLCEYPSYPRYRGSGSVNLAKSFACTWNIGADAAISDPSEAAIPLASAGRATSAASDAERRLSALRPGRLLTVYLDRDGVAWDRVSASPGARVVGDEDLAAAATVVTVLTID